MMDEPQGVKVIMKDGRTFYGHLWNWQPQEGWFSLVNDESPDRIYLRDCNLAVDRQQRVQIDLQIDVDLFERARREGWSEFLQ
jgi:hypothetical protein